MLLFLLFVNACSSSHFTFHDTPQRSPAGIFTEILSYCDRLFGFNENFFGSPFRPSQKIGEIQVGVDPRTLIPTRDLSALDTERLEAVENFAKDKTVIVNSLGYILNGHHRVANALKKNRSVDVEIRQVDQSLTPQFLIRNDFNFKKQQILNSYALSHLKQSFSNNEGYYQNGYKNRDPLLTVAHFYNFHPTTQQALLKLLETFSSLTRQEERKFFEAFYKQTGISLDSTFFKNLTEYKNDPNSFVSDLAFFHVFSKGEQEKYFQEVARSIQTSQARREWDNSYYSRFPIVKLTRNKIEVKIGSQVLKGSYYKNSILLEVPTSLIRHPAWNPLTHLASVAQNTRSGPRYYRVNLNLNGHFYLFDGNHRFALWDAKKSRIKVLLPIQKMPDGTEYVITGNIRNYLDDIGAKQPDEATLLKLQQRDITVEEIIPENFRRELLPITEKPKR